MNALRRFALSLRPCPQAASQAPAKYTHAQCDGSKWWLLSYGRGQRAGPAIVGLHGESKCQKASLI